MEWKEEAGANVPPDPRVDFEPSGYSVLRPDNPVRNLADWLRRPVVLAAVGLVVLFGVLAVLRVDGGPPESTPPADWEERLTDMENRLAALERQVPAPGEADRGQLERRLDALAQRLDRSEASLVRRIDLLAAKRTVAPAKPAAKAPAPTQKIVRHHTVAKGDTLYSISRAAGISVERLMELNGLKTGAAIHPGDRLRLVP